MKRKNIFAVCLLGLTLTCLGLYELLWQSTQVQEYNAALNLVAVANAELARGDDTAAEKTYQAALGLFDQATAEYESARNDTGLLQLLVPKPSLEIAAEAQFQSADVAKKLASMHAKTIQVGGTMTTIEDPSVVIARLKKSLQLNSGSETDIESAALIRALHEYSLPVKSNLELMLSKNPEQQQQQQQQQQSQQKDAGSQSTKRVPGDNPSDQPSKGDPTKL